MECDACKVWRRGFLFELISIGYAFMDNSRSSLLSDCTSGLVGGFRIKLDEYDDDSEGARARDASSESSLSAGGNRASSWNGEKFLGGEVASHSCLSLPKNPEFV